tara:strand:- start:1013 stop:1591 length:579 start_codon:yes stop_codon:yes gene_type:complete
MRIKNKITRFIEKRTIKNLNKEITNHISGKNVLDNGCGKGSFIYEKHKNKKIYATDLENDMVVMNRGAVEFKIADSINLPYEDNKFDCISFSGVIQYIKDYEKSLSEIKRVLKNNGRLIIASVNKNSFFRKLKLINPKPKKEAGEYQIFSYQELRKELKNYNFKVEKELGVDFILMPKKLCSNMLIIARNIK